MSWIRVGRVTPSTGVWIRTGKPSASMTDQVRYGSLHPEQNITISPLAGSILGWAQTPHRQQDGIAKPPQRPAPPRPSGRGGRIRTDR